MTINQDEESVYIASPYDNEILKLNKSLNDTYIGYGALGQVNKARQAVQDSNAGQMSVKSSISRAKSKASKQYKNESWDLVDAIESDDQILVNLADAELPDEMKGMDAAQRRAFIEKKAADRARIQSQIKGLETKRKAHVATEKANMAKTRTLDEVVVGAVRNQAEQNGYKFKK